MELDVAALVSRLSSAENLPAARATAAEELASLLVAAGSDATKRALAEAVVRADGLLPLLQVGRSAVTAPDFSLPICISTIHSHCAGA